MKIYDVSMMIKKDMQVYKNIKDKLPTFSIASDFETGSSYETRMTINLHTGTHMDFPLHMIPNGDTSDTLDLQKLITQVKVFDLSHLTDSIDQQDLVHLDIQKGDFILFKTRNSFEYEFNFQFI
jgi:arylformamidase